jgi:rare lipoprotein A (peptidoglycan hydrolase)
MKRFFIVGIILFLIIFSIYPEKWVGQVATYNLMEGSKTADGGLFNGNELSAACNGFKLGATVSVVNVKTGKSVDVKITDRVNNDSTYFILLTPKAAGELGLSWETSLVVVEGKFTDINSTEILNITGLVAEGTVDQEQFKKFPDVNWPENDKTISKMVEEKNKDEKIPLPNMDNQTDIAKKLTPETIMKMYALDEDEDEMLIPKKELTKQPSLKEKAVMEDQDKDEKLSPKNDIVKKPVEKEKDINLGKDKDEQISPDVETLKTPPVKKNSIGKDIDDKLIPKNEVTRIPAEKQNKIGKDEDKLFPKNDTVRKPDSKQNNLDADGLDNPKTDITKKPYEKDNKISGDDIDNPKKEELAKPEKTDNKNIDKDTDALENPKEEIVKTPLRDENPMDNDVDTIVYLKENPKEEIVNIPSEKEKKIDGDLDEKLNPVEEIGKKPDAKENKIDEDVTVPEEEIVAVPGEKESKIDKDDKIVTAKKKEKLKGDFSSSDKIKVIDGTTKIEKPKKEKLKGDIKVIDKVRMIDQTTKIEKKEKPKKDIEWLTDLKKGEIYIRFSATFEKSEGERRLNSFRMVFKNVVGLKENNKYILLIGPVKKEDVDRTLNGVRGFGYRDAYVIKK